MEHACPTGTGGDDADWARILKKLLQTKIINAAFNLVF